jgi:hypothetical protein
MEQLKYVISVTERDPFLEEWKHKFQMHGAVLDTWGRDNDNFGRRGHIRTKILRECDTEWLCFVDADMIYGPEFFPTLIDKLPSLAGDHRCYAAGRMSMGFDEGYKVVDSVRYETLIDNPFEVARTVAGKTWLAAGGRASGAGFFQLVHVPSVREYMLTKYGSVYYVAEGHNCDNNTFQTNHITRSDRAFRVAIGGVVPITGLPPTQLHINHYRKQEERWKSIIQH